MSAESFVIGVDFGTDSVRVMIVNADRGQEISTAVCAYPRWREGLYCDAASNQFRQHPLDYVEALTSAVTEAIYRAGARAGKLVRGISIDTTGSTPIAVDATGLPLAMTDAFADNPNAMFILWKDHTAVKEAAEFNEHATQFDVNYLQYVGGIYSSEWFWAKLLHVLRTDLAVQSHCYSWVEHCDWIPFLLTGGDDVLQMKRGVCAAGHKALWSAAFNGLPPDEFFSSLDPLLKGFTKRLFTKTYTADQPAGRLSTTWAARLGLEPGITVGIGAFDCHMGAVGGQIEPYVLSKVMGTSTCDMMVVPVDEMGKKLVKGICGQVEGSILPGMIGLEAGQSAFGDTFAWFKNLLAWPLDFIADSPFVNAELGSKLKDEVLDRLITELSAQAMRLPLREEDELAVDWLNGRRTPDADQDLKGIIAGLSLASDSPRLFKALVEATCFGARAIVARFEQEGIPVKGVIGLGGVARKSPYIMQVMADVLNMPIRIHRSEQTCALGAAMFAATASGIYPTVSVAMERMGQGFDMDFHPRADRATYYDRRFNLYRQLGQNVDSMRPTRRSKTMA